jgi:alpha-galactosidase
MGLAGGTPMLKITMIGAGSVVFAKQLTRDILAMPELENLEMALMDIDAERLDTAVKVVKTMAEKLGRHDVLVKGYLDRKQALRGARYVINAVQVGMHEATLKDFEIPRKYGLKQTIADTLGPGGVFRALRTIPVMLDLSRDMQHVCPDAWLLNYTNPMAMLCLAMFKASPIKTVGLCHSVQNTAQEIAWLLGLEVKDITYRVAGINHMAFYLELKHRGQDLYPRLWEVARDPKTYEGDTLLRTRIGRVRLDVFQRIGYFITESSEHLAEYTPWFIKREDCIPAFQIPIDEYIRRSEQNLREYAQVRDAVNRGEAFAFTAEPGHEYAAYIIRSIETNKDWSFNGNVYNRGLITNLPTDSCVEVPCLVNAAGIQPTVVGDLPLHLAALNRTNINVQQLTVEGALTGKRDYIYHAIMLDPHTSATLTLDEIWKMTDELFAAHEDALRPLFGSQRTHVMI